MRRRTTFSSLPATLIPIWSRQGKLRSSPPRAPVGFPPPLRGCHVESAAGKFRFSDTVRALVRFKQLNLLKDWPMRGPFDAIFCRNVMIYFDQATQDGIWARFAHLLPPGGHLYIGHSERIASDSFSLAAQTAYRRAP